MPSGKSGMRKFIPVALAIVFHGCAPFLGQTRDPAYVGRGPGAIQLPPMVVYQQSTGPLSYRATPLASGPLREVQGQACQSALTLPIGLIWAALESGSTANAPAFLSGGWGQGGYAQAIASAMEAAPNTRLVGVRADLNTRIILGVWRQQCVRVLATVTPK